MLDLCSDTAITTLAFLIVFMVPPLLFYRHDSIIQPIDPLTSLFYEVSAHHVASVNCTFTDAAFKQLSAVYQTTFRPTLTADPPSPLHRAVYVFVESTLHRWATQCL